MLEVVSLVLVALGIMLIYVSSDRKDARQMWFSLVLGTVMVIIGGAFFVSLVGVDVIVQKIVGLIVFFFGIFMLKSFPDIGYNDEFKNASFVVGLIALAVGVYMLFF